MNRPGNPATPALNCLIRLGHHGLWLLGMAALLLGALQFTNLPWLAYKRLADFPHPTPREPTLILLMGGGGIPGDSGLMRTYYAARAAERHPGARILVAMPFGTEQSYASRAYLDELHLRGVPPERTSILSGGTNTREQALRLAEHLGPGTATEAVLVVSDPSHIRRVAGSLRGAGIVHVAAMPAHPFSIEDSPPWASLADPALRPPSSQPAIPPPTPSSSTRISPRWRYDIWTHLGFSHKALREYVALAYYRLRGWIPPE